MDKLREPVMAESGMRPKALQWPWYGDAAIALNFLRSLLATDAHAPGCRHLIPTEYVCDCGKGPQYAVVRGEACRWLRGLAGAPGEKADG